MRSLLGTAAAAAVLGACYDLSVDPNSGVSREKVLNSPADLEVFAAGTFLNLWASMTNGYPWASLSVAAEQMESSNSDFGMYDMGKTPREPLNNAATYARYGVIKNAWAGFYEAIANADDVLGAIERKNLKIIDITNGRDNTSRTVSFSKMIQGVAHLYLGMLYDQAVIIPETIDLQDVQKLQNLPLKPYTEVIDSGMKFLDEALAILDTANFILPRTEQLWIYGVQSSSGELEQFIHSQIARTMVYSARTPAERDAVDWQEVLNQINQGIVNDFGPRGRPNALLDFGYWYSITNSPVGNFAGNNTLNSARTRTDLRIIGPADTSAAYRTWLAKVSAANGDTAHPPGIASGDKRIEQATAQFDSTKGGSTLIRYYPVDPPTGSMPIERGKKYYSNYWFNALAPLGNAIAELATRQHVVLTVAEMNMLKAEAFIRLGREQEAADIINVTRTAPIGAGPNLAPVTVNGTVGPSATPAEIAACVPKRTDGTCGDLWDALIYEKRLITYGYDALTAFADMRGWGCLAQGTPLQLPVPADQLILMGLPVYTFGGTGPSSAGPPSAQRCRMFYLFS
jgi:hypothetical protein